MEPSYSNAFRAILKRLKAESNYQRYTAINTLANSDDEEQLWSLCKKFFPENISVKSLDIAKYCVRDNLDEHLAFRYIKEIEMLLDKLGWEKE